MTKNEQNSDGSNAFRDDRGLSRGGDDQALEDLVRGEQEADFSDREEKEQKLNQLLEMVVQRLSAVEASLSPIAERFAGIESELQRLKNDERILADIHSQCQQLSEHHHEREVLRPVFLTVIGIIDRCDQKIEQCRQLIKRHARSPDSPAMRAIRHLLEARNADRVELESLLANYGVEPFTSDGTQFDPATQTSVHRIECRDDSRVGQVAERLRCGYRRNQTAIRREHVNVYVRENGHQ